MDIDNVLIDIGISCTLGYEEFAYLCMTSMIKLAKNPSRLRFYLGMDLNCNGEDSRNTARLGRIKELVPDIHVEFVNTGFKRCSYSHGTVINRLYSVFTSPFCIITDNDLLIYRQYWDSLLMEKMINGGLTVYGMAYDEAVNPYNYKNFPCATFCVLKREDVMDLNLDFVPFGCNKSAEKINATTMNDPEICKICNIPVGSSIKFDTGSDLYLKIKCNREKEFKYEILKKDKGSTNKFNMDGQLFLTHYGQGGKMSKKSQHSIQRFNEWIVFIVGYMKNFYKINVDDLLKITDKTWFN